MKNKLMAVAFLGTSLLLAFGEVFYVEGTSPCTALTVSPGTRTEINAYIDDKSFLYIQIGDVRGYLSKKDSAMLIPLLEKAQSWSSKARAEKTDIQKELGNLFQSYGYRETGVSLHFVSAASGTDVGVKMDVRDFDNKYTRVVVWIKDTEIQEFIDLLKRVPATIEKMKEMKKKAESFK